MRTRIRQSSCWQILEMMRNNLSKMSSRLETLNCRTALIYGSQSPRKACTLPMLIAPVKTSTQAALHPSIRAFNEASAGWSCEATVLSELEWDPIAPLFDGVKREPLNLGQKTLDSFEEREAKLLEESERDYLRRL